MDKYNEFFLNDTLVRFMEEENRGVTFIARCLDVTPQTVRNWIKRKYVVPSKHFQHITIMICDWGRE